MSEPIVVRRLSRCLPSLPHAICVLSNSTQSGRQREVSQDWIFAHCFGEFGEGLTEIVLIGKKVSAKQAVNALLT